MKERNTYILAICLCVPIAIIFHYLGNTNTIGSGLQGLMDYAFSIQFLVRNIAIFIALACVAFYFTTPKSKNQLMERLINMSIFEGVKAHKFPELFWGRLVQKKRIEDCKQ